MKGAAVILFAMLFLITALGCVPRNDVSDDSASSTVETNTSQTANVIKATPFTLAYSSNDTLNPYNTENSVNLQLCSLIFEGLARLDNIITPKPLLAGAIDSSIPSNITATLRKNAKFSDGSGVTLEDVINSFDLAKKSDNYKMLLSNVKTCKAEGDSIIFELNAPDPNATACLTFPILKKGSEKKPIGSGRYIFKEGDSPKLVANTRNSSKANIKTIHLLDVSDGDAILYALESGSVSYYFTDLAGGDIPRTSSASIKVPLNSVVFIGINSGRSALSKPEVRLALSNAVNRKDICAGAFAGRARPATTPFNPNWASSAQLKGFKIEENITAAVAQLELAGYNNKSTEKNVLSLELLVSEGNSFREASAQLIKSQFAKVGIKLTVVKDSFNNTVKRIKSGDFDLYIGEVLLPFNMSLGSFLSKGGKASYGIKLNGNTASDYIKYLNGNLTLQEFTDTFTADVPYIPICWRDGMAAYNRSLSGMNPISSDIFYGLESSVYS
ncbi:MAG: ABC transporter substrate-binding protein [Oscillospiraceae bacterium]|nr:ABC transporter substrate-binding protein [Oscillospiraceae bacterium]MDD3832952.1 ABC transporter substrate-binding protein [Oscillospiraceae bacterium]MDD4545940.1 ABC transporter substrate-binding protein [Oscillospiraceae bacterium]